MKIISFNTYLAPTMPNRFYRKKEILKKINKWMYQGIDVICLQELNDFKIGLFGYIYYTYRIYNYCNIFFQRFFDLLYIIEGFIFPVFLYNNSDEFEIEIVKFNLTSNKKYYFIKSSEQYRGVSGGLVILTLHKPIKNKTFYLKSDCINSPSILLTKLHNLNVNIIFNVLNIHLIPNLENHTFFYKTCNCLNYLNNINVYNLQKNNIENLNKIIYTNIFISENIKQIIFIIGDFNIKKNKQKDLYNFLIKNLSVFNLKDTTESDSNNFICTEHFVGMKDGEDGCEIDQIDYIFSNVKYQNFKRMDDCFYLSDHYPIITEFI